MSDNGIVWEDPQETRGQNKMPDRSVWFGRLDPLRERPGQWARVFITSTTRSAYETSQRLKKRLIKIPTGQWEFTARKSGDKGLIYARYLGPEEEVKA